MEILGKFFGLIHVELSFFLTHIRTRFNYYFWFERYICTTITLILNVWTFRNMLFQDFFRIEMFFATFCWTIFFLTLSGMPLFFRIRKFLCAFNAVKLNLVQDFFLIFTKVYELPWSSAAIRALIFPFLLVFIAILAINLVTC